MGIIYRFPAYQKLWSSNISRFPGHQKLWSSSISSFTGYQKLWSSSISRSRVIERKLWPSNSSSSQVIKNVVVQYFQVPSLSIVVVFRYLQHPRFAIREDIYNDLFSQSPNAVIFQKHMIIQTNRSLLWALAIYLCA